MDILPAIDLIGGKCVRLLQGDYAQQIDYSGDPVGVAREFERAGARWLHVVDLDGAKVGRPCNLPTIRRILAETSLRVEVGGGLREAETIEELIDAGVQRCIVGTKALEDWEWFKQVAQRPKCANHVALGLDAKQGRLAVRGWLEQTALTAVQVAQQAAGLGVSAIIYTDISRDGMLSGPNIEATLAVAKASPIPVIASGGVTTIDDVRVLCRLPLGGIIIGRAIYERRLDLAEAVRIATSGEES
ncbi:MAG TPA: 1-(5-phosphoribosyl)-5-[(5-phosphoribosylamino)methylideneamino]imidazole-4-carboxamide isomerase [Phycisphaerae bacterium]|nr:1-(5-phosphoribosyl)-5-[(5-phosphoribosylamino)methylideneamino]imidazole-4-carboxamide isomerase [Phycisphaerae bacterium]